MVVSIDLQILLRLGAYPVRGHRLLLGTATYPFIHPSIHPCLHPSINLPDYLSFHQAHFFSTDHVCTVLRRHHYEVLSYSY